MHYWPDELVQRGCALPAQKNPSVLHGHNTKSLPRTLTGIGQLVQAGFDKGCNGGIPTVLTDT